MSQRQVLQVFEQYQKARTQFVQMVAELATRPQNIETLQNAGVMSLLRPLLLDVVPTIQQTAALALGRLANYNDDLAEAVVKGDILPQLVYSLAEQNRFYKKAAAFVLRAVGKHSPQLAQAIVDCGALDTLVICLEDFDPGVKEAAAWALGYIARHNTGARNCFEKDCCLGPQRYLKALPRVSADGGGCRSHCSPSPDDPQP